MKIRKNWPNFGYHKTFFSKNIYLKKTPWKGGAAPREREREKPETLKSRSWVLTLHVATSQQNGRDWAQQSRSLENRLLKCRKIKTVTRCTFQLFSLRSYNPHAHINLGFGFGDLGRWNVLGGLTTILPNQDILNLKLKKIILGQLLATSC